MATTRSCIDRVVKVKVKLNLNEVELLPEDIQFQILLWLPVVSLLRFKSVCKSWYSHIQSSCFISKHKEHKEKAAAKYFHYNQNHIDRFIVWNPGYLNKRPFVNFSVISNFEVSEYLNTQGEGGLLDIYQYQLGGMACFDGIVLYLICYTYGNKFTLWNPATRQFRLLPQTHHPLQDFGVSYGFGFDFNTDDYKVVKFICPKFGSHSEIDKSNYQVEVYSLNNDSWTSLSLDFALPISYIYSHPRAPYRNGTTYCWLGHRNLDNRYDERVFEILSFDFTTQVFGTIPLPNGPSFDHSSGVPYLSILRDNIACINTADWSPEPQGWNNIDIWVLNEYCGAKESWTRLYRIGRPFLFTNEIPYLGHGIGFSKNGDSFLFLDGGQLFLYNLVTQERKRLPIPAGYYYVVYKESLLSVESRKERKPPRSMGLG